MFIINVHINHHNPSIAAKQELPNLKKTPVDQGMIDIKY
jgi:hypothetical protein